MRPNVEGHKSSSNQWSLGYRVQSPLYLVLSSHLLARSRIFLTQNDLYNLLWAVFPFAESSKKKELADRISSKLKEAVSRPSSQITTESLLSFALGVKILRLNRGKEDATVSKHLEKLLDESQGKNWLNAPEAVSTLVFALGDVKEYQQWMDDAAEWLSSIWSKAIQSSASGSPLLIDLLLGLSTTKKKPDSVPFQLILEELPKHSIEKISKFVISLKTLEKDSEAKSAADILQSKLTTDFGQRFLPEIELSLAEGAHLAASGLSEPEIRQILLSLKKEGVGWAQALDVGEGKVCLRDINARGVTDMSPIEESLSVMALKAAGLDRGYHLTESEHKIAIESVKIVGKTSEFIAASRRGLSTIVWLSALTIVFSFVAGAIDASQVLKLIASGVTLLQALLSLFTTNFSLPGVLAVLYLVYIIFYLRVIFVFRSKGKILRWWEYIPGIRWLGKQLHFLETEK